MSAQESTLVVSAPAADFAWRVFPQVTDRNT